MSHMDWLKKAANTLRVLTLADEADLHAARQVLIERRRELAEASERVEASRRALDSVSQLLHLTMLATLSAWPLWGVGDEDYPSDVW